MGVKDKIKPVSTNHSIKEAVISVFLVNPILKPQRFQELIKDDFQGVFQRFEKIDLIQYVLKHNKEHAANLKNEKEENTGFRFTAFNEFGSLKTLLQANNEKDRTYISYHTLEYNRWKDFYDNYETAIRSILKIQNDIFVTGFSLTYIDEFEWIDNDVPLNAREIFNESSEYLPNKFINSIDGTFSVVTQKKREGEISNILSNKMFDRLEISLEPYIKPVVRIFHTITQPLEEIEALKNLLNDNKDFKRILDIAHKDNKDLLKAILKKDVQDLINLT